MATLGAFLLLSAFLPVVYGLSEVGPSKKRVVVKRGFFQNEGQNEEQNSFFESVRNKVQELPIPSEKRGGEAFPPQLPESLLSTFGHISGQRTGEDPSVQPLESAPKGGENGGGLWLGLFVFGVVLFFVATFGQFCCKIFAKTVVVVIFSFVGFFTAMVAAYGYWAPQGGFSDTFPEKSTRSGMDNLIQGLFHAMTVVTTVGYGDPALKGEGMLWVGSMGETCESPTHPHTYAARWDTGNSHTSPYVRREIPTHPHTYSYDAHPYVWGAMLRTHTYGARCAPILYSKTHVKIQILSNINFGVITWTKQIKCAGREVY